jgi:hypothetical protein
MNALRSALGELWGLFVEDPRFTLAIALVLGIVVVVMPALHLARGIRGPLLFLLLAVALVENVLHSARR